MQSNDNRPRAVARRTAEPAARSALRRAPPARRAPRCAPWLDPKLLAAAKAEGPLTVYSSTNEQEGLPLFKIFEEATGIKFQLHPRQRRLADVAGRDRDARQPADPSTSSTFPTPTRCRRTCWRSSIRGRRKHILPVARDPGPALVRRLHRSTSRRPTTPRRVQASDLPKSFEEFAQRKEWAGKVAIDHTDIEWLRGMLQFYGEQKGTALVARDRRQPQAGR